MSAHRVLSFSPRVSSCVGLSSQLCLNCNRPSSTSSLDWPSTSRAPYLLCRGSWEGEVGKEGVRLQPRAWLCLHGLLSFRLLPSAWPQEDTGAPRPRCVFSAGCSLLLPVTTKRLWHCLQESPGRLAAHFCGSSVEDRVFCWVETTAKLLLTG